MSNSDKTLRLDKANRKIFGVCAGIADYLDVKPWTVRLVCIVGLFVSTPLILISYLVAYFLMDGDTDSIQSKVSQSKTVKHFKNVDYKKRPYRNTRNSKFLGVCSGIADYLEVSAFYVRVVTVIAFLLSPPLPLIAYFAGYFMLDEKPEHAADRDRRKGSPDTGGGRYQRSRSTNRSMNYCEKRFATLQQRLARLEAYVTSSRYRLHREFKDI